VLFVLTAVKIFLMDLWSLGQLYRVASFIGLAVVLILDSYLYQRFVSGGRKHEPLHEVLGLGSLPGGRGRAGRKAHLRVEAPFTVASPAWWRFVVPPGLQAPASGFWTCAWWAGRERPGRSNSPGGMT
jgi:hypothetical protein